MIDDTMKEGKKIRLVALDLDRTTLRDDKSLSPANREAIQACLAAGIHVVVASGRAYGSLPAEVMQIPGLTYAITGNGAAIYALDESEGTVLFDSLHANESKRTVPSDSSGLPPARRIHANLLTPTSVRQILELVPERFPLETFVEGIPFASAEYVKDPMAFGAKAWAVDYVQSTRRPVEDIRAFIIENIRTLDSLDVVIDDASGRQDLRSVLEEKVEDVYITASVPQLIEISHRDSGKAYGLRWIAEYLGIPLEETVAFGDAENDREMLAAAGLGVAMENAGEAVKAVADRIAPSNEDDGVACVLQEILYFTKKSQNY